MKPGLYEQVINRLLDTHLSDKRYKVETEKIEEEESARILSKYLTEIIEKGLTNLKDNGANLSAQIELCNKIIDDIAAAADHEDLKDQSIEKRAELLLAFLEKQNTIHAFDARAEVIRPLTSISRSSLFTGAPHEPSISSEFKKEILSCNRIDMLVSFIKFSGLRLIIEELREFTKNNKLRVITTSYMGATDLKAIETLRELPNTEIKISYDTKRTRLHAKTYVYYRDSGYTTAYVGSSNMSNAAMSDGLEWNVKVTAKDQPDTIKKIEATFENYWNSNEFVTYTESEKANLEKALRDERNTGSGEFIYNFDIKPYPFQREILDNLDAERKVRDHWKNLVVAATGTGKTVVSAFDYKRFREENRGKPNRLLFIAHREEILKQSINCFKAVLRDPNFGELFVGSYNPSNIDNLFMSIQTFNSREFDKHTRPDFYDYIIIDEFHHAAAPSYQRILEYYTPKILLGLTATPERMDGKSVLEYFDNRIAAEIRLPEAIERKLLSTFQYFGVSDEVDLSTLKWARGGYDKAELDNIYTGNDKRSRQIIQSLDRYCTDINEVKGLGFCVSIKHAEYMADFFNKQNIPSIALTSGSDDNVRNDAKNKLVCGDIRFIFVVDLYNEGVDIPEVNTIMFLRPTESLTIFLQQLGRGLRISDGKDCLTVLDFIGQANRKYSFEEKFKALLTRTTHGIQKEIKDGFANLPRGCFIALEKTARDYILENIRKALGTRAAIVQKIASFKEDTGIDISLANFADHYHLDVKDIYSRNSEYSFSRLCVEAGVIKDFNESDEAVILNGLKRLCSIDSRRWIRFIIDFMTGIEVQSYSRDNPRIVPTGIVLNGNETRMLLMFHYTIWQKSVKDAGFKDVTESIISLKNNPVMFSEIVELLKYRYEKIDFIDEEVDLGFDCPLDLHCSYTRDQILSAVDFYTEEKMPAMREGVKSLPDKKLDLFLITLNKSEKDYSPTTMYNDYSINETLFHMQSQSTTSESSPTGTRYINHRKQGVKIALFVREFKTDNAGASAYTFLGLAGYVSHEGSRPMNIIWKLEKPIPAKYYKKTNKLIAG
jgi:superfamily II DNA or RNA helicase